MMVCSDCDHLRKVAALLDEAGIDMEIEILDGKPVPVFNVNDVFCWGYGDLETIEPGDIELLEKCLDDLTEIDLLS